MGGIGSDSSERFYIRRNTRSTAIAPYGIRLTALQGASEATSLTDLAKQTASETKAIGMDIQVLVSLGLVEQTEDGKLICPFDEIRAEFALKRVA